MQPVIYNAFSATGGVGLFFSLTEVEMSGFVVVVVIALVRHFLNQCDTYMDVKVVHGSRSNNHCSWSDTLPSVLLSKLS